MNDLLSDGGEHEDSGQIGSGKILAQDTNLFKGGKGTIHDQDLSVSKTTDPPRKVPFVPPQFKPQLVNNLFQLGEKFGIAHSPYQPGLGACLLQRRDHPCPGPTHKRVPLDLLGVLQEYACASAVSRRQPMNNLG